MFEIVELAHTLMTVLRFGRVVWGGVWGWWVVVSKNLLHKLQSQTFAKTYALWSGPNF